jgi:hypothetical protein
VEEVRLLLSILDPMLAKKIWFRLNVNT